MHSIIPFLLRHGYWVLAVNVLAEQIGLPIPAVPVLLGMGALAGLGHASLGTSLAIAVAAAMVSDVLWFRLGRVRGHSILNLLCRVSLEPDSCVGNTKSLFSRLGARALMIAKFVPGLGATAAPLAGLTRMNPWKFLAADATGATAWSGAYLAAGYLFHDQLETVAQQAGVMGSWVLLLIGILIGVYVCAKYYQRRRFIRGLRVARITPQHLRNLLEDGEDIAIVDLRHAMEVRADNHKLPRALWLTPDELEERHEEIPRDRDVVLYCS